MAKPKKSRVKREGRATPKSVRSKILAVLSREKEVYDRKSKSYVREPVTMREAAKKVGVSVRTLQRWKNEGTVPRAKTRKEKARVERLDKAARKAEGVTVREMAKDRRTHPKALRITKRDLPVLPVGHRRRLKHYKRDKKGRIRPTGEEYDSSIVNYNVRGWSFREIAALVLQAWKAKKPFQFVYEVPAGGSLPKSGRSKERRVKETTRAGTAPIDSYGLETQAEVLDVLNRYIDIENGEFSRRMIYIAIDDNYSGPREDDEAED